MPSLNTVILMGNLTRDPELHHTPRGVAVADIGLAINRTFTQEGERREETTFVDITFFGRTAETVSQHLRKGSPILVEGSLRTDSWEDKQTGQRRSKLKVVADNFQFIGGRETERVEYDEPTQRPVEEDIPF